MLLSANKKRKRDGGFDVVLFYCYTKMEPEADGKRIKSWLDELGMSGRLIIANEGINGTLSGGRSVRRWLRTATSTMGSF